MTSNTRTWLAAVVLTVGFVSQANAAFPFPPFQCPWFESRDCPRSSYCCLHYIVPSLYTCRAYHTPPRLIYGCQTDVSHDAFSVYRYPCRASDPSEQATKYIEVGREPGGAAQTTPAPASEAPASEAPAGPQVK
jgi:hypothetical protein